MSWQFLAWQDRGLIERDRLLGFVWAETLFANQSGAVLSGASRPAPARAASSPARCALDH